MEAGRGVQMLMPNARHREIVLLMLCCLLRGVGLKRDLEMEKGEHIPELRVGLPRSLLVQCSTFNVLLRSLTSFTSLPLAGYSCY